MSFPAGLGVVSKNHYAHDGVGQVDWSASHSLSMADNQTTRGGALWTVDDLATHLGCLVTGLAETPN